jgi:hypothetical protein
MPDELLVRRAREGHQAAYAELFGRHRDDAYRLAYIGTTLTGWPTGSWGTSRTPWTWSRRR